MKRVTNFIEMNSNLFRKLYGFMTGYPRKYDEEPRWIKLNKEEKEFCNSIYVKDYLVMENGIISCLLEREDESYFAIIGEETEEKIEKELFHPVPVTKEYFLRITSDLDIKPISNISPYLLEETVLFYNGHTEGYDGHDPEIIVSYFPNIKLFSLNKNYSFSEAPLVNLTGYFLCEYSQSLAFYLDIKVLNQYKDIFSKDFETLNYNILLRSLLNPYYKDVFMDIYRCIEYLYKAVGIKEIQKNMCTTLDIEKTYEMVTIDLKYKFTESYCINLIFNRLSKELKENINSIDEENVIEGKEDEWFYSIRNSLVHGRRKDKEVKLTVEQWIKLIDVSLKILIFVNLYAQSNNLTPEFIHRLQKN